MKTVLKTIGLVAMTALAGSIVGCSPAPATTTPSSDPQAADTAASPPGAKPNAEQRANKTGEGKVSAPANVTLKSSAKSGTVVLTLTVEALEDIPRGVARIVIPTDGGMPKGAIKVAKGDLEVDLGALAKGEVRELQVTLEVPQTGRAQIFAGVDCHITSGIQLHKEAQPVTLGE